MVDKWWRQWPEANIGLATGAEAELIVIDADAGRNGLEFLQELEEKHGRLPETVEVSSGGGGQIWSLRPPRQRPDFAIAGAAYVLHFVRFGFSSF